MPLMNCRFFLVQFHIGHLYEMQNKCQNAREAYEAVALNENVPNDVKSNVYKQLGKLNCHNKGRHLNNINSNTVQYEALLAQLLCITCFTFDNVVRTHVG